jgi:hypothetical protein
MPSENCSVVVVLPSTIDNSLLSEDAVTDKLSLSLELLMLVLFVLSVIYGIKKNRKRTPFDLENAQSVLRDIAQQRQRVNFSDEYDSSVYNPTTPEDKLGRGVGGGDDRVQLSSVVVQHKCPSMVQSERIQRASI